MAELQTVVAQACPAEDSDDDEYVYVSSLAEQIAGALMLDDEEEPPALQYFNQPSVTRSLQQELWNRKDTTWPDMCAHEDIELQSKNAESMLPVPHVAAAWRDDGLTEWDCFHMPSSQQASRQLSHLYTKQLERRFSKQRHLSRGWDFSRLASNEQVAAAGLQEMWNLHHQEIHSAVPDRTPPIRKRCAGTGVFLPNIASSSSHYRRKAGFSSAKSVYGPRHTGAS